MTLAPVKLTFLQPFTPQLAYAVLHLAPMLEESQPTETSIHLESAVGIMQRTVLSNDPHTLTLDVEEWPWDEVMSMIEGATVARNEAPTDSPLREAAQITLQFLANYISELQHAQAGERHILSIS